MGSLGAREAVPAHDFAKRGEVGLATGGSVEDGRNLEEVVGAEGAGCEGDGGYPRQPC